MELSLAQELEGIIEKLVTSGGQELDKPLIKKLKLLCKKSNDVVKQSYYLLLAQLQKDHAEIRYLAFLIINELFVRSHCFRLLLLEDFNEFMDLTIETDFENPLPPPKPVADRLKAETFKAIKVWHDKYGIAYSKLALAVQYLTEIKMIKLHSSQPRTTAEGLANEEHVSRMQIVNNMKLEKLKKAIEKHLWEIRQCILELNNTFLLILPNERENIDIPSSSVDDKRQPNNLEAFGISTSGYSIEIDLSTVLEMNINQTQDNEAVIEKMKDCAKLANCVYLPRLRKWLSIASKCCAPSDMVKKLIEEKESVQQALTKYKSLNIKDNGVLESDESDLEDFVEVPDQEAPSTSTITPKQNKRSKVSHIKTEALSRKPDTNVWKPLSQNQNADDPTSYQFALKVQEEKLKHVKASNRPLVKIFPEKKAKSNSLYSKAPIVPFGRDLYSWDKEKEEELRHIKMGSAKEYDVGHRFWSGTSPSEVDTGISDAALTALTTRTIEFSGEFKPVVRSCRAPLPSGKLCPRQDRFKCPFHGNIIDRDISGAPKSGVLTQNPSTSKAHRESWEDTEYLRDIEKSSGGKIQLTKPKRKRKNNKPENGLTDLRKLNDTSRTRLSKKILNSGSLKRVASSLNSFDDKRNQDKFGNNFNYALN